MINNAIGASGVVSKECKSIVAEYGQTIMNLLLAEVSTIYNLFWYILVD
jgi:phytepsin